jgi:hypothetical protein
MSDRQKNTNGHTMLPSSTRLVATVYVSMLKSTLDGMRVKQLTKLSVFSINSIYVIRKDFDEEVFFLSSSSFAYFLPHFASKKLTLPANINLMFLSPLHFARNTIQYVHKILFMGFYTVVIRAHF